MKEKSFMPDPNSVSSSTIPTVPAPMPIPTPTPKENKSNPAQDGSTKDSDPTM